VGERVRTGGRGGPLTGLPVEEVRNGRAQLGDEGAQAGEVLVVVLIVLEEEEAGYPSTTAQNQPTIVLICRENRHLVGNLENNLKRNRVRADGFTERDSFIDNVTCTFKTNSNFI